jgi:tetratricopeptide (TPR) repeat protein
MLWLLAGLLLLAPRPESIMAQEKLKEGQKLMSSERFEEAAEAFRAAIRLDPVLVMAHYGLGQAHMALRQYPSAVTAFQGAREAFHARTALGVHRQMEYDNAREDRIRELQDRIRDNMAMTVAPGSRLAQNRDIKIRQYEAEISTLRTSQYEQQTIPELPPGLSLALGSAHFRSGQFADAEREYRAALAVKPSLGEPRNNLAVVLLLTGRPAEAKAELTIAEKNGFKVSTALKNDVEAALVTGSNNPRP